MKKFIPLIPLIMLLLIMVSCSQEKKLLRKASVAVDQSDYEKAIGYYDQCIEKNERSFFGNAGKGIVLSEYMSRHEQAIPYLEKALANSPPDKTKPILHKNLGKSYHFIGNYARALTYYGKLDNDPDYSDYDEFLTKRISDCKYAIEHPEVALPENQNIFNAGNTINTDKPEYTPVFANGNLYFTSKRQEDPKEKRNGIDGKYFEKIYVSALKEGAYTEPARLQVTEPKGFKLRKNGNGESVASVSPDGRKLIIYKGGTLFETDVDDKEHKINELDKNINFSKLQNHASISPDGNTIYFTSESEQSRGGSDIFFATRNEDGSWSEPRALDYVVNTPYDEEAPYISENGDLFFSSNGHPGYGGFDVYRTRKVNGSWIKPENLGQPINSPGDDIFFTLMKNSSKGYYASARPGGHGDLDIYKVHYVITETPQCEPDDKLLTINAEPVPGNPLSYNIGLTLPEAYSNNVRSYRWEINGKPLAETSANFRHTFNTHDNYKLLARVVAGCDTCPRLTGLCAEKTLELKQDLLTSNKTGDSKTNPNKAIAKKVTQNTGTEQPLAKAGSNQTGTQAGPNPAGTESASNRAGSSDVSLSENELKDINWNLSEAYFDYDSYSIRAEAKTMLDHNISILKNRNDLKIIIYGFADSRGSVAYNKNLSLKRAGSVKDYFLRNGIDRSRIKNVKGFGEDGLVNGCSDGVECEENQHQQNRRVKLEVTGKKTSPLTLN